MARHCHCLFDSPWKQYTCGSSSDVGVFEGAGAAQALPEQVLQGEYELVQNAFYTEPHDQSSWLYLRWLIGNSLARWQQAKGTPQESSACQVTDTMLISEAASECIALHLGPMC